MTDADADANADANDSKSILDIIRAEREKLDRDPGTWPAKRELAGAVRELVHCLSSTDASEEELLTMASQVRETARRFSDQPRMTSYPGVAEMSLAGGMEAFRDRSPLVGLANPLAPPLELDPDPEAATIEGRVRFGRAYEGAPGCVHGGFVAAVFDEALGMACAFSGKPGMTGEITISYRKPTPVQTPLRVTARMDRMEGRKIYNSGELYAGDTLLARSTGIFISIATEKFSELRDADRKREAGRTDEV
jgi:acyl-coenzyme A thioesterase PaaI-like protein